LSDPPRKFRRRTGPTIVSRCVAAALCAGTIASLEIVRAAPLAVSGELGRPQPLETGGAAGGYPPETHRHPSLPHPAVARIVVPEGNVTSYGSGTLVDARDQFGLVVTNWHVVRDGRGEVEVIFPNGFRSMARPLKVDPDWDLAALVIWRPPIRPVTIARDAPQPGDQLTICGYGSGQYRAATGRCTQYYAPALDLPQHMVELDVEARQGDSGGPIFNAQGELAGVLFGAGGGTTLGSFGGRVGSFLATLAPDIGHAADRAIAQAETAAPRGQAVSWQPTEGRSAPAASAAAASERPAAKSAASFQTGAAQSTMAQGGPAVDVVGQGERDPPALLDADTDGSWQAASANMPEPQPPMAAAAPPVGDWFAHGRNVLAIVGALAIAMQALRLVR
jgi:hypothetical protein